MGVKILLGTNKGAFFLQSDAPREDWAIHGPFCDHWPINHVAGDGNGRIYAAGGSEWHGLDVWRTDDFGKSWARSGKGIDIEGETIDRVWSLACTAGSVFAGVRPAALFRSEDGGETWQHLKALSEHPSRGQWQPGGAGLTLHHIVPDPQDPARIWVGISTAGVFFTEDGGRSWEPRNHGTRADFMPEDQRYPEIGQCVHGIALAGNDILYQQNHCGMYRSDDAGKTWRSIEAGLPSSFGFPVSVHPRDAQTAWYIPMNGDSTGRYMPDAKAAVWRTRDGGATWHDMRSGLPQRHAYLTVLRQAMAVDSCESVGVYFGTASGTVFGSRDEGETWDVLAEHLPMITSVETITDEA
ncbi:WD40/YVTN/BNR-like repeat-containing protein [Algicella marina]|uniref:Exo-alpha-sialidase n=1 Tax=Algicella marina TaxID=2683284 RepID=A0A6P1SYQ6_9RHOB|nr:exo-alpha-sialidase [Algicella marina]QHQ35608.1 exo-alpha-sialidase [Algicella marina]